MALGEEPRRGAATDGRWALGAWVPPALALLAARLVAFAAALAHGDSPWRAGTWIRWDSLWYLRLARDGYVLVPCAKALGFSPHYFCGQTGWFPGYPALISLLVHLGVGAEHAGILVAGLAHGGLLLLIWNGFLGRALTARSLAALTLAAFFPGAIYAQAVFPVSLFVLAALAFVLFASEERYAAAAAAGAGAAFVYPTGFLLAVPYGAWLLFAAPRAQEDGRRLLPLAGVGAGFAAVGVTLQLQTGRWDAFFLTQAAYGYGLSDPLRTLLQHLVPLAARDAPRIARVTAWQTLVVAVLAATAGWVAARRAPDARSYLLGVYVGVYWLFPLVLGGQLSLYRSEALLLPSVALLKDAPRPLLLALVAAALALAFPMATGFFDSTLV